MLVSTLSPPGRSATRSERLVTGVAKRRRVVPKRSPSQDVRVSRASTSREMRPDTRGPVRSVWRGVGAAGAAGAVGWGAGSAVNHDRRQRHVDLVAARQLECRLEHGSDERARAAAVRTRIPSGVGSVSLAYTVSVSPT